MATQGEQGAAPEAKPKRPKKKVSPARNIVGLVLLALFSTVAVVEWDANRRANGAVSRLHKALEDEQDDLLSMKDVQAMIGRAPDGQGIDEGFERKFTYTWRGLLRKRVLNAYYTRDREPHLIRIETE